MTDLTFIEAQPWKIEFSAHDEDGDILPLTSGAEVEFRVNGLIGGVVTNLLTIGMDNGVVITNPSGGIASITVALEDQENTSPPMTSDGIYFYEIRVAIGGVWERQAEGRLYIDNSLFAAPVNSYLEQFRAMFPEFDDTPDGTVALYIDEATAVVRLQSTLSVSEHASVAILYYAAHLIQMRKRAALLASSGGAETLGQIKSVSVEDRTVTFATSTSNRSTAGASTSTSGLGSTIYGQRYLAYMRMYPQFILRA